MNKEELINLFSDSAIESAKQQKLTTIFSIRNHLYIINDEVLKINRMTTPQEYKSELEELGHNVQLIEL